MNRAFLVWLSLSLAVGCSPKSAPEFYQLQGKYEILKTRQGDEAYFSPELQGIIDGLYAIPEGRKETAEARALGAAIIARREALQQERAVAEAETRAQAAQGPTPSPFGPSSSGEAAVGAPGPAAGVPDAGPPRPYAGMSPEAVLKLHGDCLEPGEPARVPGKPDTGASLKVKDSADCRARLGDAVAQVSFVFYDGGLVGELREEKETVRTPERQPVDASVEEYLIIPGAPIPPGYTGTPGLPVGESTDTKIPLNK